MSSSQQRRLLRRVKYTQVSVRNKPFSKHVWVQKTAAVYRFVQSYAYFTHCVFEPVEPRVCVPREHASTQPVLGVPRVPVPRGVLRVLSSQSELPAVHFTPRVSWPVINEHLIVVYFKCHPESRHSYWLL